MILLNKYFEILRMSSSKMSYYTGYEVDDEPSEDENQSDKSSNIGYVLLFFLKVFIC